MHEIPPITREEYPIFRAAMLIGAYGAAAEAAYSYTKRAMSAVASRPSTRIDPTYLATATDLLAQARIHVDQTAAQDRMVQTLLHYNAATSTLIDAMCAWFQAHSVHTPNQSEPGADIFYGAFKAEFQAGIARLLIRLVDSIPGPEDVDRFLAGRPTDPAQEEDSGPSGTKEQLTTLLEKILSGDKEPLAFTPPSAPPAAVPTVPPIDYDTLFAGTN